MKYNEDVSKEVFYRWYTVSYSLANVKMWIATQPHILKPDGTNYSRQGISNMAWKWAFRNLDEARKVYAEYCNLMYGSDLTDTEWGVTLYRHSVQALGNVNENTREKFISENNLHQYGKLYIEQKLGRVVEV
jgi:hypothetical protein